MTSALQMRWRLRHLMKEHRIANDPVSIALAPPTDHPMILDGYASTTDLDLERVKMRGWAFPLLPWVKVPLLYRA